MCNKLTKYTKEERLDLLRQYYESGMSMNEFARAKGIKSSRLLAYWMKLYDIPKEIVSLQSDIDAVIMSKTSENQLRDEVLALRKRVQDLEKALEYSRLETSARDIMIDLAEQRFEIPIRKKSAAKQ